MHFTKQLLIAAIATIAPAVMHGATITSNPTLSIGGLTFNGFTCSLSKGGVLAQPSSCGQVNVNTTTVPGTGIEISSGFTAALGSFSDAVINYHVSSNTGINNVGLDFDGSFAGLGIASVSETVYSGSNQVGFADVTCGVASGCTRTDNILLNGTYTDLSIKKDINVTAAFGSAQTSIIDQTFSSTAPEPSSMALFGSGLVGAAALLRRKTRKTTQAV